jgi:hypothetical protein
MKLVSILLVALVVVGAGGYFGYNIAYARGETAGYESGYPAGEESGYISGRQDGHDEGYASGKQEGRDEGYKLGKTDGYGEGYSSGKAEGEQAGFSAGRAEGYETGYAEGIEAGTGHGFALRDPTYAEVMAFLNEDRTDKNEYDRDTYDCSHFTRDVSDNAEKRGFRSAAVLIDFVENAHVIVAFNTVDRGMVYIEPQFDDEVKVEMGRSYSQLNNYQTAGNDTVTNIVIIW